MESNEKFATYKEFGKMLREVADLCAKLGDTPCMILHPTSKKRCSTWSIEAHTMRTSSHG